METMNSTAAVDFDHSAPAPFWREPSGTRLFLAPKTTGPAEGASLFACLPCSCWNLCRRSKHTLADNYDNGQLLSNSSWITSRNTV